VSGQDDPVGQFGHGVQRVAQQLAHAGFTQVQQVLYPGLRHEILQEASKQQVYQDVATWLTAQVVHATKERQG